MREERKVVTALFADLVDSTALAEDLDPEDVAELVGGPINAIIETVEAFGGTIKDLAGDGVLALFGAPVAHEDDAIRAVRAGLEIVERVADYSAHLPQSLSVRVGIHSGLVVLGPVGTGSHVEYGAVGDAVNIAARLQAAADPGTVLVGTTTRRYIEPIFEWGETRDLVLKGKRDPVSATVVRGVLGHSATVRGLSGVDVPTTGRNEELSVIRSAAERLLDGGGASLVITGEAGLGKSRLLGELRRMTEGSDRVLWLQGTCVSYAEHVPLGLFRSLLQEWLAGRAQVGPTGSDLRSALRVLLGDRSDHTYAFIASVTGSKLEPEDEARLEALSPETLQHEIFSGIESLVEALAEDGPVVVALEDLHWADSASLQLAARIVALSRLENALVVLTSREEKELTALQALGEVTTHLRLDRLADASARDLLALLVEGADFPADLEQSLLERAEGNPLYVEELVRGLIDAGALVREDGRTRFLHSVEIDLPETIERLIQSRLDILPTETRSVVDAAAVIGRAFSVQVLGKVAEAGGVLQPHLDELVSSSIVVHAGSPGSYEFKHALIQEAAYQTLLKKHRRELHLATAHAIEDLSTDLLDRSYGILAKHYEAAGELGPALDYHRRAAEITSRFFSIEEALDHYDTALRIAQQLDDEPPETTIATRIDRARLQVHTGEAGSARAEFQAAAGQAKSIGNRQLEMEALNELGFASAGAADYRAAIPYLEAALDLARNLEDEPATAAILSRLSIVYTNQLHFSESIDRGRTALAIGRAVEDRAATALALDSLTLASAFVGDLVTMDEVAPELIAIHESKGDLWYLQFALYQSTYAPFARAEWKEAFDRLDKAYAVNRRIRDRGNVPIYLATLAWMHRANGNFDQAIDFGRRAVEHADDLDHTEYMAWTRLLHGWTLEDLYLLDEAEETFARGARAAQAAGATAHLLCCMGHLADIRLKLGRAKEAHADAEQATTMLDGITAPEGMAFLQGAHATVSVASVFASTGDPERAEKLLTPVADAARKAPWREMSALGSLGLSTCAAERSDTAAALEHGRAALREAETFELPGIAWRAHAVLAVLESHKDAAMHSDAAGKRLTALADAVSDERIRQRFIQGATTAARSGGRGEVSIR